MLVFLVLTYAHNTARMFLVERNFADFAHYYFFAGQLHQGTNIYSLSPSECERLKAASAVPVYIGGRKAEYAPAFFLAMAPFAALPFWPANLAWFLLNQLALAACAGFCWRIVRPKVAGRLAAWAAAAVVLLASQPLLENVGIGQVNILILLALLAIGWFQGRGERDVSCGMLLAAALALKPQFGILFVFFLLKRRYRLCVSAAAAYAVLQIVGCLACGPDIAWSYWQNLLAAVTHPPALSSMNLSIGQLFRRALAGSGFGGYAGVLYGATALSMCTFTILKVVRDRRLEAGFALVICLALLISPHTVEPHLVLAGVPLLVAFCESKLTWVRAGILAASFGLINARYSLASFHFFDAGPLALLAFGKTFGLFLLWGTLLAGPRRGKSENVPARDGGPIGPRGREALEPR